MNNFLDLKKCRENDELQKYILPLATQLSSASTTWMLKIYYVGHIFAINKYNEYTTEIPSNSTSREPCLKRYKTADNS